MLDDFSAEPATPEHQAQSDGRNYSALTARLDPAAVREFRRRAKADREPWAAFAPSTLLIWIIVPVLVIVFLVVGAMILSGVVVTMVSTSGGFSPNGFGGGGALAAPVIGLAAVAIFVAVIVRIIRQRSAGGQWARWYRLFTFAAANGLSAHPHSTNPQYPGSIFGYGNDRVAYDRLQAASGRFLDIGNYRFSTGSGDDKVTRLWGFMALRLDRRLPHMMLDARSNNALFGSNLPVSFSKDQVLSLEGDFDRHFTLYCPRDYQRDALYIFTPDLMALLIDNAGAFDVEIVDDWMFVYSSTPFDMIDEVTLRRLFRIVDTVGAKTLSQSERYRDERMVAAGDPLARVSLSSNRIGAGGSRLKRRTPWPGIVIFALIFAGIVYFMFTVVLGPVAGEFFSPF
ncbi:hypothetical protein [Homoserinimonas sp. OAct 916]|uniref:hypothetical protein n=1 Tax=Homoserinimonas sp. OAct 916 TaxID=2211450 RepID=UPI000DBE060F|nr:hypothetical protein [Homoserinimonas sp. OAct 916]